MSNDRSELECAMEVVGTIVTTRAAVARIARARSTQIGYVRRTLQAVPDAQISSVAVRPEQPSKFHRKEIVPVSLRFWNEKRACPQVRVRAFLPN